MKAESAEIVQELGNLPLAIERADAYIQEASKDLFKFLLSYRPNRKIHHFKVPRGNRTYTKSVASTWLMSFEMIAECHSDAIEILRLFVFLNPDNVLINFLETGKQGLNPEVFEIITDLDRFYEALSELERFSLIRRELGQRITIHRLVQSIVKDEMSHSDSMLRQRVTRENGQYHG